MRTRTIWEGKQGVLTGKNVTKSGFDCEMEFVMLASLVFIKVILWLN
jgi:hypothetical protein